MIVGTKRPYSQFNVTNIKEWPYICSKHFVCDDGPTDLHSDPIFVSQIDLTSPTNVTSCNNKSSETKRARYSKPYGYGLLSEDLKSKVNNNKLQKTMTLKRLILELLLILLILILVWKFLIVR